VNDMMHQPEHNTGDHEDPIAGQTWMVSFVGTALLIVIFLGLTALYYNYAATEAEAMIIDREPAQFNALTAAQLAQLQGVPRWEERQAEGAEEGVMDRHLVIPIDQAKRLVVEEYGHR